MRLLGAGHGPDHIRETVSHLLNPAVMQSVSMHYRFCYTSWQVWELLWADG